MAEPVTYGKLQTNVSDMIIGDYIAARYTTEALATPGSFSELGTVDVDNTPLWHKTNNPTNGVVYFIKIAPGILMCNSLVIQSITFNNINAANLISGNVVTIGDTKFLVRVPSKAELRSASTNLNGMTDGTIINIINNFFADGEYTSSNVPTNEMCSNILANSSVIQSMSCNWRGAALPLLNTVFTYGNDTARPARLVLEYVDNPNSTDLFH